MEITQFSYLFPSYWIFSLFITATLNNLVRVFLCLCAVFLGQWFSKRSRTSTSGSPGNLFSSVQFSRSVVSDSLRPYGSQHTSPPCPSPTPGIYPNSCPLSWWCHPTISSSVIPFSSCSQSFPAYESIFSIMWPKDWSFSFNISPSNEHSGLISFKMD